MSKFIFDLGANDGCSARKFAKIINNFEEYSVFCFEPGLIANSAPMKETLEKYSNIILLKRPVSNENRDVLFYEHTRYSSASTTWEAKAKDKKRPGSCGSNVSGKVATRKLKSIDIGEFISSKLQGLEQPEVIIKCDIEGEEYRVIPHLLKLGIFKSVRVLYLEWHREWNNTSCSENDLVRQIKEQNSKIIIDPTWNALGF